VQILEFAKGGSLSTVRCISSAADAASSGRQNVHTTSSPISQYYAAGVPDIGEAETGPMTC
jgi:hypothetical protein